MLMFDLQLWRTYHSTAVLLSVAPFWTWSLCSRSSEILCIEREVQHSPQISSGVHTPSSSSSLHFYLDQLLYFSASRKKKLSYTRSRWDMRITSCCCTLVDRSRLWSRLSEGGTPLGKLLIGASGPWQKVEGQKCRQVCFSRTKLMCCHDLPLSL